MIEWNGKWLFCTAACCCCSCLPAQHSYCAGIAPAQGARLLLDKAAHCVQEGFALQLKL
jgi:hypothetical protein